MNIALNISARQAQSLAMTAEVIQSIKLLQCSHEELWSYLREQAERNPLLSVSDRRTASSATGREGASRAGATRDGLRGRVSGGAAAPGGEKPDVGAYIPARQTLQDHLLGQMGPAFSDPADRMIAVEIIGSLDDDGYLRRRLDLIADALGTPVERTEAVLQEIRKMDPAGVGARDLAECLAAQLAERDMLSEPMAHLLENLPALAAFDYARLMTVCGVDSDEILAMAETLRQLDPRPGSRFDADPVLPALPDVSVRILQDGTTVTELNTALLPRVLVDRQYYSEVRAGCRKAEETRFVTDCMRDANWLVKNVDLRARTILKVVTEVAARQKDFLLHGVEYLKPLNLKDVADAVGIHQSTVCRAIANKFVMTDRGMFELKYFFSNAIPSTGEGDGHAPETVRQTIRQMIGAESADSVLSDDALVKALKTKGIDIARRTVAKYREGMNIPSSLHRRRRLSATQATRTDKPEKVKEGAIEAA
ncbi:UNVERIFIED_ORG: RNA polymerase RpoN-/SigL-like sigma 54 subunit [Martelella mediterranea]